MLNIVLPIAGRGSQFVQANYRLPKPLIPVHGKPMIELVVNNIRPSRPHRFTFLVLQEHLEVRGIGETLTRIAPDCLIIPVRQVTEGSACTVLLARTVIENDDPLMLFNSDQWVEIDINDYLGELDRQRADGLIMTMKADDPKWSYVRCNDAGKVVEVVEKQVVSNEATVGIYNFRRGQDFVRAADHMIAKNFRVNNEFYVAPAYNEMIAKGAAIVTYNVGSVGAGMYGLGTPADLEEFLSLPISQTAVQSLSRSSAISPQ